jgi:hypothetical protein
MRRIVTHLGYSATSAASGPDGNSDHTTDSGLERTLVLCMGEEPLNWANRLAKDEQLSLDVYNSFLPVLPKTVSCLYFDHILEALRVYERIPSYNFAVYEASLMSGIPFKPFRLKPAQKYAFIINTGMLDAGIHWVVLYVDLKQERPQFFDSFNSYGMSNDTAYTLSSVIDYLQKNIPQCRITNEVVCSKKQFQHGGVECGVYVTHFVISRIKGMTYVEFEEKLPSDSDCRKLRDIYWNHVHIDENGDVVF